METSPRVRLSSGRTLNFKHSKADSNQETVVFIHGLGKDLSYWDYHIPRLNEYGIGTVRVDLHGHGDTPDQHGEIIPADDQVDDVTSLICELGIDKVRVVGHSYGGYVALALPEFVRVRDKLVGIDAWMPYLQHLGIRASDEIVDRYDDMWNLNPLHRTAMMMPFSPWSMWYRAGRAAMKRSGRSIVRANTGKGVAEIVRRLGPGAGKAALGLPEDIIKNPPYIPSRLPVRIFLGGPDSMQPGWLNLPFESNRMAYDFAEDKPNVTVIDSKHGGHYTPSKYPEDVIHSIVGSR
jgi:pimeloyl-ACP methyl ester carboxylesterase